MLATLRARNARFWDVVFGPNGLEREELLLAVGLALIARGLWMAWQPGAFIVPGIVLVYIALPSRAAFVARPPAESETPARARRRS